MTRQEKKQRSQDWRKDLQGATPEKLAKGAAEAGGQDPAPAQALTP